MAQEYGESDDLSMEEEISWLRSLVALQDDQLLELQHEGNELSSNCVILMNNTSAIVSHICGIVRDLTATVELFQRNVRAPGKTGPQSPLRTQRNNPRPDFQTGGLLDLGSCMEEFTKVTKSAKSALAKASKDWKNSQERMKSLRAKAAKVIIGKILEKKKEKKTVKPKGTVPGIPKHFHTPTQEPNTAKPRACEPVNFPIRSGYAEDKLNGPGRFRVDYPRDFSIKFDPVPAHPKKRFQRMPVSGPGKKPKQEQDDHPDPREKASKTPDEAKPEGPCNEDDLDRGSHTGCSSSSAKRNDL